MIFRRCAVRAVETDAPDGAFLFAAGEYPHRKGTVLWGNR